MLYIQKLSIAHPSNPGPKWRTHENTMIKVLVKQSINEENLNETKQYM